MRPLFIFNKRPSLITQKILGYFDADGVYNWIRTEENSTKYKIILYKYLRFGPFEWRETTGQIQCDKDNSGKNMYNLLVDKNMIDFLQYLERDLCDDGYNGIYGNIDNNDLSIYEKFGFKKIYEKNKCITIYKELECEKYRREFEELCYDRPQVTYY